MNVYQNSPHDENTCITIGSFDGLHLGHLELIKNTIDCSKKNQLPHYIISFEPHPRLILENYTNFQLLNATNEKVDLLEHKFHCENLILLPFDASFAQLSAEGFIMNYIVKPLKPRYVFIGFDHKFGKDRSGSKETFEFLNQKHGLGIQIVELHQVSNSEHLKISSTHIREYIKEGNIVEANLMLGYPYRLHGIVVKGAQNGRKIHFPTANLSLLESKKLVPKNGVYVTRTLLRGKTYQSMTNIGFRPTLNGTHQTIETHIFNFDLDIYGEEITLECLYKIRDEQKFSSLEELQSQLEQDKKFVLDYFEKLG